MLPNLLVQKLLYETPTIGDSIDISVTDTAASTEFFEPGLWLIQNMGPDIVYMRMFTSGGVTHVATTSDFPLFPFGSFDMSSIPVQIGMIDRKLMASGEGHYPDLKFLSALTGAPLQTATLRATRLTKD